MTHSNYEAKMDELLAAVDRLESKNNLSLMATAAMQSAMRTQSAKIVEMRDKVLEMESTVTDLKVAVNSMSRNIVTLAAIVGVPP